MIEINTNLDKSNRFSSLQSSQYRDYRRLVTTVWNYAVILFMITDVSYMLSWVE